MKFYGLTGGIGAGKSTVASLFKTFDVPVLDLDKVGHKLLDEDKTLQQQLVQAFGDDILVNGNIDRKKLADKAFQSKKDTQHLNQIMHPAIVEFEKQWRECITATSQSTLAIIEASVLIESGGVARMDGLIVVLANKSSRQQRVAKRQNYDALTFDNIVKQQTNDEVRKQHADMVIENNKDLSHLKEQVYHLYNRLTQHH